MRSKAPSAKIPSISIARSIYRHEIVTADRKISQAYLDLASECFNRAVMAEQPAAEALRLMGRRYVTQAATLERRSLNSAEGVLRR
jgi:hypothetical protein